jgi:hypothetical protein
MAEPNETETRSKPKLSRSRVIVFALVLVALASIVTVLIFKFSGGLVPKNIQKQVNFHVYYPAQDKIPAGYKVDTSSFRTAASNVVLFSVNYSNGRSMVFSESEKPSGDVIDKFNASAIPIHTQVSTAVGKALVGAYGSGKDLRTIASLPIPNGPWLIITAPSDINQADLEKVLQAIGR